MGHKRRLHITVVVIALGSVLPQPDAATVPSVPAHRNDRILVQPKRGVSSEDLATFHSMQGTGVLCTFEGINNLQIVTVPPGTDVPTLIARYQESGLVEFAEPDYFFRTALTEPNDPLYLNGTLWSLNNTGQNDGVADADIDAPEAWDILTSASNIVVAVLDTGVRLTHEDLADNLWVNPLDGSHGWNALSGTNYPEDDGGHGTLVAGVLGAVGNNGKGVVGIAWRTQIMALKCFDGLGMGSDSDVVTCIDFARTNGAHIINASFNSETFSMAVSNAILSTREAGILFVASAGNDAINLDGVPWYPSCYNIDNVISVAASTRNDVLWGSSNYGATNVDLAAPGVQLPSTFRRSDTDYITTSGTSLAAPYVAGTLALLRAKYPAETHQQLIQRLLAGVDPVPALAGKCGTGGRLNLRNALSPPVILTTQPVALGQPFQMRISGGADRIFVILATTDFDHWTPLEINTTGPEGYADFVDGDSPGFSSRFYQVFAEP